MIDDVYKEMLAKIDIEEVRKPSTLKNRKEVVKKLIEENNSLEKTSELLNVSKAHLRLFCKEEFGIDWYNKNTNHILLSAARKNAVKSKILSLIYEPLIH